MQFLKFMVLEKKIVYQLFSHLKDSYRQFDIESDLKCNQIQLKLTLRKLFYLKLFDRNSNLFFKKYIAIRETL